MSVHVVPRRNNEGVGFQKEITCPYACSQAHVGLTPPMQHIQLGFQLLRRTAMHYILIAKKVEVTHQTRANN